MPDEAMNELPRTTINRPEIIHLVDRFLTWDSRQVRDLLGDSLSTVALDRSATLPPYVPFVGEEYWSLPRHQRVLCYATAQNMGAEHKTLRGYQRAMERDARLVVERLYYTDRSWKSDPLALEPCVGYREVSVAPYMHGFLPFVGALAMRGLGVEVPDLEHAHSHMAVSNYFKFSMHSGQRDLNPWAFPADARERAQNHELNAALVAMELEALDPGVVIVFGSTAARRVKAVLEGGSARVIGIQDRAWVLRGAGGRLRENGPWRNRIRVGFGPTELALFDSYMKVEDKPMAGKEQALRTYFEYHFEHTLAQVNTLCD